MNIFVTSDLHFNHNNILKYEPESRPFGSIEEMNETLINNWNSVVKSEDLVYVIGDFFMGKKEDIEPILTRLNGKIILVRGNHDHKKRRSFYEQHGIECKDIEYLSYKGTFFIMCHYPVLSEEFWDMVTADNKETIFLYGHIHSKAPHGLVNKTFHVGVDTNNLTPVNLDDILKEKV